MPLRSCWLGGIYLGWVPTASMASRQLAQPLLSTASSCTVTPLLPRTPEVGTSTPGRTRESHHISDATEDNLGPLGNPIPCPRLRRCPLWPLRDTHTRAHCPRLEESSAHQRKESFSCFVLLKLQGEAESQPRIRPFVLQTRRFRVSSLSVQLLQSWHLSPGLFTPSGRSSLWCRASGCLCSQKGKQPLCGSLPQPPGTAVQRALISSLYQEVRGSQDSEVNEVFPG